MTDEQELQRWREALAEKPVGWDFSTLAGYREEAPPWSWRTLVENLAPMSDRVLDLGTGGGEVLESLVDVLPEGTVATEGWAPNLRVARARLAPLGIEVLAHGVTDAETPDRAGESDRAGAAGAADALEAPLPVPDASFDLILARHEAFDATEIARVLMSDGAFLTQQVGSEDAREIREAFGIPAPYAEVTLENIVHQLGAAGLRVDRSDSFHGRYEFDDMPTLLRYLRRAPWDAPEDLDVDRHRDVLEHLHAQMQHGPLVATASRFVVLARAPEAPSTGRTDFADLARDELEVPRV